MRKLLLFCLPILLAAGCVVNPDADKVLRDGWKKKDSVDAAERGVLPVEPDTGQHAMPVAPIAPGDMPVVNPADSAGVEAK